MPGVLLSIENPTLPHTAWVWRFGDTPEDSGGYPEELIVPWPSAYCLGGLQASPLSLGCLPEFFFPPLTLPSTAQTLGEYTPVYL